MSDEIPQSCPALCVSCFRNQPACAYVLVGFFVRQVLHACCERGVVGTVLATNSCFCNRTRLLFMQYAELAFTMYKGYYYYAAILLSISLIAGFSSTVSAFQRRMQMYTSIAQRRLLPLLQKGYIRYVQCRDAGVHHAAICHPLTLCSAM